MRSARTGGRGFTCLLCQREWQADESQAMQTLRPTVWVVQPMWLAVW